MVVKYIVCMYIIAELKAYCPLIYIRQNFKLYASEMDICGLSILFVIEVSQGQTVQKDAF